MQNQPFVQSLISLRDNYQMLNEEYEQKAAHAKEQLTHVNALLVEQLALENRDFLESLIALRNHYQGVNQECERKASHAREQLIHVNTLLVDQLVLPDNQQPVSIKASRVNQDAPPVLRGADMNREEPSLEADEQEETNLPDKADEPKHLTSLVQSAVVLSEPVQSESSSVNSSSQRSPFSALKTPMLPKYQQLTKSQAVERLLRENSGTILHVDYIVHALHGKLEPDAMKAERPRMYDTLSKGASKGLWDRVPDQASCYTIDLKLVAPLASQKTEQQSKTSSAHKPQSTDKSSSKMLPLYQELNLVDAISVIVRENSGKILNIDFVARALYGELSGQALTKAKERVGKALWSGAKQKRWQRVPKRLGSYTLDMKLVK